MSNPRDLFLQLLGQALWLERMLVHETLPSLERSAEAQSLARAFEQHLEQTRGHVARVERVFSIAAAETSSIPDRAAEKLVEQHDEVAKKITDRRLADVFHAAAAARTEHHELATYSALIALADALELPEAVQLLEETLAEEATALEQVEQIGRRLAREAVNAH